MTRKVFILEGHPHTTSFGQALALAAKTSAEKSGHEVRYLALSEMQFDMNLSERDPNLQELEDDLETVWGAFLWANHILIIHPLWWGGPPAKLKGLFDRILRPGHAYSYVAGKPLPKGLLEGGKADVIITSDTPTWFFHLIYRYAWPTILRRQILGFCGLKVGKIRNIGPIRNASDKKKAQFLELAEKVGRG